MKPMHRLICCLVFMAILTFFGSCVKNIGQIPINFQVNPAVLSLCGIPLHVDPSSSGANPPFPLTASPAAGAGAFGVAMFADLSLTDSTVATYNTNVNGNFWYSFTFLSQARSGIGAGSVDNKVFFAGGQLPSIPGTINNGFSSVVDIFNISPILALNTPSSLLPHSVANLSEARALPAVGSAGHVIAIGGGMVPGDPYANSRTVDFYNNGNNTWSNSQLSVGRGFLAAAGWGTKILFGGGEDITSTIPTDLVDIYDINSTVWTVSKLSQARSHLAAAATCNKIFFAGGLLFDGTASDRVDIYDVPTGTWSTAQLSEPRIALSGVVAGNRIFFGGGYKDIALNPSKTVDVYDLSSGTWSTFNLNDKSLASAPALNKAVFIGGNGGDIFAVSQ